jgi:hypothetical protein
VGLVLDQQDRTSGQVAELLVQVGQDLVAVGVASCDQAGRDLTDTAVQGPLVVDRAVVAKGGVTAMAALALLAGEHVQPSGLRTQGGRRPSQPHSSRRSLRSKASPPLSALHATVQRYAALCSSDRLVLSPAAVRSHR